jgi:hypothetical protein
MFFLVAFFHFAVHESKHAFKNLSCKILIRINISLKDKNNLFLACNILRGEKCTCLILKLHFFSKNETITAVQRAFQK